MTDGNDRFAQTFTAQASGSLTTAQANVSKPGTSTSGDWIMQINAVDGSGVPTNTILASTTIPDSAVPAGFSIITGNFATPATVAAGQIYALVLTRPDSDSFRVAFREGDVCPGALFGSLGQNGVFVTSGSGRDLVFAVFVEPPPPEPGDTTPPGTSITKGPKDKTEKKEATFEFTSTEPGSTFQCILDGKTEFKPCSSPITVKVKKGKHAFQVQATDPAGNTDLTPATDDWKRKKKKN